MVNNELQVKMNVFVVFVRLSAMVLYILYRVGGGRQEGSLGEDEPPYRIWLSRLLKVIWFGWNSVLGVYKVANCESEPPTYRDKNRNFGYFINLLYSIAIRTLLSYICLLAIMNNKVS